MTIIIREHPTDVVARRVPRRVGDAQPVRRRSRSHTRPAAAESVRHRGTGVLTSRASHRPRPVTPFATVVLALLAAGITVWLGLVAELAGPSDSSLQPGSAQSASTRAGSTPPKLAVVRVQQGESLQQLAQRIAPTAPAGAVVEQIRSLNKLDSVAVDAGQPLVAPVG